MTVRPLYFDTVAGVSRQLNPLTDDFAAALGTFNGLGGIGVDCTGNRAVNFADPVNPTDGVNLRTAQQLAVGVTSSHEAVVLASSNQTLTGAATIDGVVLATGQQVLLIGQTNAIQNGLWLVNTAGAWSRPSGSFAYSAGSHAAGAFVFIQSGTTFAYRGYIAQATPGSDVVDTNSVSFVQFSGFGLDSTGQGLHISDNTLSLVLDPAGALGLSATGLASKVDGITAGIAANALSVLGVPSLFTVGGAATNVSVSAGNLNAVTGGSYADSQHKHTVADTAPTTQRLFPSGTASITGPVTLTSSGFAAADITNAQSANSKVLGVANSAGTGMITVGLASGVLSGVSGVAKGSFIYAAAGGGYTTTQPSASGNVVYFLGIADSATDLNVQIFRLYAV